MKIAAITGTNGKSSTIHYAKQLLEQKGNEVWTITNKGILEPGGINFQMFWCRERGSIRNLINDLSLGRNAFVLIEAYSISLLADEWAETMVDLAAFTSFGRDHLDVHSSMDEYFEAKFSLFQNCLKPKGAMIINEKIPYRSKFEDLSNCIESELIFYNDKIEDWTLPEEILPTNFNCAKLISEFLTGSIYSSSEEILVSSLPGRLEKVKNKLGIEILIDFAHNPDGLSYVFHKITEKSKGKIITVLGCGGERDQGKRLLMGEIVNQYSDKIIITDDNPRSENPSSIRKSILEGCPDALEVPSRKKALKIALMMAKANDILLVAGMGSDYWTDYDSGEKFTDNSALLNLIENF